MSQHPLFQQLVDDGTVVILRGLTPDEAIDVGEALVRAGIRFMEVPLNRPGALEAIRLLAGRFAGQADVHVGAGTVLTPEQVDSVRQAGGEFIISPNTRQAVIRRTRELELLSMPGFATPTEAFDAIDAGADLLKVFPYGTPENIAVLKSVIPLPVFAVGGVTRENRRELLSVADGVGVGIGIYRPGMMPAEVHLSAKEFLEA